MKCPLFGTMSGPCFTMLKPHLAYIYFQMSQSSENFKTESIRSKEYVYGVSNFWDPFGPSLDQVGTMFSLPFLLSILLNNLSVCWFSHILTQVLQWQSCRPLVLFLLYHEVFSDHEPFTNCELHKAYTLENSHMHFSTPLQFYTFLYKKTYCISQF